MNTFVVALACLLAVAHANPIGLGPIWAPAAVSTANLVKASPIPVIRTIGVPVVSSVIASPVVKSVGWGGVGPIGPIGPLGVSSLGWNGLGLNSGLGWNGLGWNGLGWNGLGWNGVGLKGGLGWH